MSIADLGAIGELVGSLVVLITLIYIAVQTRQAKEAAINTYLETMTDQRIRGTYILMDSPYIPPMMVKLQSGETLSEEEKYRFGELLRIEFVRCRSLYSRGMGMDERSSGVIFGGLRHFAEVAGELVFQEWLKYKRLSSATPGFVHWIESNVDFGLNT